MVLLGEERLHDIIQTKEVVCFCDASQISDFSPKRFCALKLHEQILVQIYLLIRL